jgi:hypothetical protein
LNELDEARWVRDVTQAWEKISDLMKDLSTVNSAESPLIAKLLEAITDYKVIEANRYKAMTSKG